MLARTMIALSTAWLQSLLSVSLFNLLLYTAAKHPHPPDAKPSLPSHPSPPPRVMLAAIEFQPPCCPTSTSALCEPIRPPQSPLSRNGRRSAISPMPLARPKRFRQRRNVRFPRTSCCPPSSGSLWCGNRVPSVWDRRSTLHLSMLAVSSDPC